MDELTFYELFGVLEFDDLSNSYETEIFTLMGGLQDIKRDSLSLGMYDGVFIFFKNTNNTYCAYGYWKKEELGWRKMNIFKYQAMLIQHGFTQKDQAMLMRHRFIQEVGERIIMDRVLFVYHYNCNQDEHDILGELCLSSCRVNSPRTDNWDLRALGVNEMHLERLREKNQISLFERIGNEFNQTFTKDSVIVACINLLASIVENFDM